MKKHLLFKSLLLLFALVVGSSSVWAQTTVKDELTASDFAATSTTYTDFSGVSKTSDAVYAGNSAKDSNGNIQLRSKSSNSGIVSTTSGGTVKSVKITVGSGSNTIDVYGSNTAYSDASNLYDNDNKGTKIGSLTKTGTVTFPTETDYEYVGIRSNSGAIYLSKIEITWETSSGSGDAPTISADPTSLSTFTYVKGNGPSAAQTISVSGSNLSENLSLSLGESSNYEMCLTENGTYTNSLSLTPTTGTVSATYVYVRLKSGLTAGNKDGSITLTSSGATDASVSLSGSVTTLAVTYNDNGSDSGTAPTDESAYAYNAKVTVLGNTGSLTKEHYTFGGWNTQNDGEGTNYAAGDKFDITANTTLYAKWVINTNSVTLPDNDEYGEYSMNKSNPVAYGTEVTLTYTPAVGYENYVATWSVNGEKISGNKFTMPDANVTVTVSLNEVFDMTLSNSDIVSAGDAADGYDSKTITDSNNKTWNAYAIKKAHSGATSSYHFLQIRAYDSSKKTAYYIQVPEYGRKITKLEMTVSNSSKPMTDGGNTATLFFSASNSTSATGTGVASGTGASTVTIDCSSLNLNTGYITASGAVRIWDVKVTYDPIRLNGSGYATYAGLTPINYSDGSKFTAWAITEISGDAITFSKITGSVPAGTGVLLMGTAGQAVEPVVAASGTAPATNLLTGTTTATAVTADQYYGLFGDTFKKVNAGTVPAGRALLPASEVPSTARELTFVFDEATGIKQIETSKQNVEGYFNLAGQRVAQPTKGLYIVNGRKVVVK